MFITSALRVLRDTPLQNYSFSHNLGFLTLNNNISDICLSYSRPWFKIIHDIIIMFLTFVFNPRNLYYRG